MKKWIIAIGLTVCAGIACAQEQDIVKDGDPWYLFREHGALNGQLSWWDYYYTNKGWAPCETFFQYSDKNHDSVTVYGVAATTQYLPLHDDRNYIATSMAPTMMIYQHVAGGDPPTWAFLDSANVGGLVKRSRFMYSTTQEDYVVPCYEFYFDTPHHFFMPTDTFFYIGHYLPTERAELFEEYWRTELNSNIDSFWSVYAAITGEPDTVPIEWARGFYGPNAGIIIPTVGIVGWGWLFPIVELRCTPTRLLSLRPGDGTVEVSWRRKDFPEFYQVALAPADSLPEAGMLVSTTDSTYLFDSLLPGTEYLVWVRKACRYTTGGYDTLVYSEWSSPLTFSTLGIGEVGAEVAFSVSPNPVHGVVQVTFGEPPAEDAVLTLVDLGGREVRRTAVPAGSRTAAFDTGDCAAGAYLLKLVTPQGVATRRLLVAE